jgi:S-adenosylmethionine hydrolase
LTISSKENVETFQLDLFGSTIKNIGGENNNQEYDDDYIDITIEDSQIKQKYENTFNDIKTEMKNKDNNEENNDEDGDDLLALMDMAASKDK